MTLNHIVKSKVTSNISDLNFIVPTRAPYNSSINIFSITWINYQPFNLLSTYHDKKQVGN